MESSILGAMFVDDVAIAAAAWTFACLGASLAW